MNLETTKESKKIIPIVLCTDHNYSKYAAVTIQSIFENRTKNNMQYRVYIFHDEDLSQEDIKFFVGMSSTEFLVECINVSGLIDKNSLYSRAHYSKQMFYRWLIPEVLMQYKKVIYVDCDLVVNVDLQELYDIDLEENIVGAVRDTIQKDRIDYYIRKDLKVNPESYINSGVLVIDIQKFLSDNIKQQCLDVLKNHSVLMCPDQDALNIVLENRIKLLPETWNLQWGNIDLSTVDKSHEKYKIIHYTTSVKPWKASGANLPLAEYFWDYAKLSPCYKEIVKVKSLNKTNKKKNKKQIKNKFIRFLTLPFRMIKKFFLGWKDVGLINAMHEVNFEIKYIFHRVFGKKNGK